jgi:hypothetical protein
VLDGAVGGVVVHDDEMEVRMGLCQHGVDAFDAFAPAIPVDQHDGDANGGEIEGYRTSLGRPVLYLPHSRRQYLNGWFFKVIAALSRMMRSQLAHNALSLYAVQGLNFLMPLIVLPYLLRVLSPEGYGSIVFAQALLGYAAVFTDFGFNLTAARDISVARNDPQRIAAVYWTTMAAKASRCCCCA